MSLRDGSNPAIAAGDADKAVFRGEPGHRGEGGIMGMSREWMASDARDGLAKAPRVVPELVAGMIAPEDPEGFERAMAAWRDVAARIAAPMPGLAASGEIGRLAGRAPVVME
ncbi:MAG: hypothetical protein ACR2J8_10125, partial [Thermomicrobiales bacterium]